MHVRGIFLGHMQFIAQFTDETYPKDAHGLIWRKRELIALVQWT